MIGVSTWEEFERILHEIDNSPVISIDTEGFAEDKNRWLLTSKTMGYSVATADDQWYFPFSHIAGYDENLPPDWIEAINKVIARHPLQLHHNSKHDIKALEKLGVDVNRFRCTMLETHWIDEELPSKALDYVSRIYGGEGKKRPIEMQYIINGLGWEYIPVDMMTIYSAQDARACFDIDRTIYPEFVAQGFEGELWDVEQDFIRLVNRMEWNGIEINQSLCEQEIERGTKIMEDLRSAIGGNPSSPKDMAQILLDELSLPIVKRTPKGKPSFDKMAMEKYDEMLETTRGKLASQVRAYRGWQKTVGTNYKAYLRLLGPDGRIHPNYHLHRARTPRMSCSDPNLQNIPRLSDNDWDGNLKAAFVPQEEFELVEFDYKNLEFRLAAAYGKQRDLIAIFDDPQSRVFEDVSSRVDLDYNDSKTLTYSILYGAGIDRIRAVFGKTYEEATKVKNSFWKGYPGIAKADELAKFRSKENGYVTVWSGRRRHGNLGHKAFNAVIQGGAAEIVKRAALRCRQFESDKARMLLHIHDSLVWEIHRSIRDEIVPQIKREMERVPEDFGVSFFVDVHNWGE